MTPEMLAILRAEILSDPAGRGYDPKDAQKTADLLNVSYMAEVVPATTLENQPLRWGDVRGLAQAAGEWPNIVIRSEERPATDTVKAAINATAAGPEQMIDPADPKAWGAFQMGLQLFEAAGDISPDTVAAINALTIAHIPAVTAEQNARAMEIFLGTEGAPNAVTAEDVKEALA